MTGRWPGGKPAVNKPFIGFFALIWCERGLQAWEY